MWYKFPAQVVVKTVALRLQIVAAITVMKCLGGRISGHTCNVSVCVFYKKTNSGIGKESRPIFMSTAGRTVPVISSLHHLV